MRLLLGGAGLAEQLGSDHLILLDISCFGEELPEAQRDDVSLDADGLVPEEAGARGVAGQDRRDEHGACQHAAGHQHQHRDQQIPDGQEHRGSRRRLPGDLHISYAARIVVVVGGGGKGGAGGWVADW